MDDAAPPALPLNTPPRAPWQLWLAVGVFAAGALAVLLLGVFGQMREWLGQPLRRLLLLLEEFPPLGAIAWQLFMATEIVSICLFVAMGVWMLRRWLRCRLWQPGRVTQEALFALVLLCVGGQVLGLVYAVAAGAFPLDFGAEAGVAHKAVLALLLLCGRGVALLCLVCLWGVLLLALSYAFAAERMRQWCPFGRVGRRVATLLAALLPLAGVAVLVDHAARMHWKFDNYGGTPGTSVGVSVLVIFAVYAVAVACIALTAARVYADRLLGVLGLCPALLFAVFLCGFSLGIFYMGLR